MPTAAGIIIATGAMTLANGALSKNQPLSTVADKINWKIIPATAIAAGIFYGLEEAFGKAAVGLAWLAFFTAAITPYTSTGGIPGLPLTGHFLYGNGSDIGNSPLGTLVEIVTGKAG